MAWKIGKAQMGAMALEAGMSASVISQDRHQSFLAKLRQGLLALVAACMIAAVGAPSEADANPRRDGSRFLMSYYMSGDGSVGFILDRSGPQPVLQFNGSADIIPLEELPAARGDILLRNETGTLVLRVTSFGSATLYPEGNSRGIPLLRARHEVPIATGRRVPAPGVMQQQTRLMAQHVSMAVGKPIRFEAEWEGARDESAIGALANAVKDVAQALREVANDSEYRSRVVKRVERVRFRSGSGPRVLQEDNTLFVEVSMSGGAQGYPSAATVASFLRQGE